jgi:hypothetical protein
MSLGMEMASIDLPVLVGIMVLGLLARFRRDWWPPR